jgi:hypothetical protein
MDRPPPDLALCQRLAERPVLIPGPGNQGEEPAAVLMHICHVLGGGQFAVGDLDRSSGPFFGATRFQQGTSLLFRLQFVAKIFPSRP